jgi:integrase
VQAEVHPLPSRKGRFKILIPGLLLLERKTGVYYVRKTFRRHRIPDLFESLLVTEKECGKVKAKAMAEDKVQQHQALYLGDQAVSSKRFESKTAGEVIDEILATLTPTMRRRTRTNHEYYLGILKKRFGHLPIARITEPLFQEWIIELRRRGERRTFFDFAKFLNLVFSYAERQRYVSHAVKLENPDGKYVQKGRMFTREELTRLYDVMGEDLRDQFVLANDMMRLREVLYLTWERVDLSTGIITLRAEDVKTGSKTGKGRSFKISSRALARLIARRSRQKGTSPYVFPSPKDPSRPQHQNSKAWAAAKKAAGIRGRARWHDIRHTALTNALLVAKCSPMDVAEYAGVAIQTIQRVYLHSTAETTANVAGAAQVFDIEEV